MLPFIPLEKFWSLLITTNGCFLEVREYYCVSQQNLSVAKNTSLFSFETRFEIQSRRNMVGQAVVGIICPPGWDRVNWSAKICSDRPEIDGLYPWEIEYVHSAYFVLGSIKAVCEKNRATTTIVFLTHSIGQLISKCILGVIVSTKKPTKCF